MELFWGVDELRELTCEPDLASRAVCSDLNTNCARVGLLVDTF